MSDTFIAYDHCGWEGTSDRYTHMPSGDTLLETRELGEVARLNKRIAFFAKYPGLNIHRCPGAYSMREKVIGTTDQRRQEAQDKLNLMSQQVHQ